jgi:hypothetical protein
MSNYIQNYGFTKTLINDNNNYHSNEIKWKGDYDGKIANIGININDNGNNEFVSMKLNNSELRQMFGIQPVEVPLEERLLNDFFPDKTYSPISLEGALIQSRRHRTRHNKGNKNKSKSTRRKTRRSY